MLVAQVKYCSSFQLMHTSREAVYKIGGWGGGGGGGGGGGEGIQSADSVYIHMPRLRLLHKSLPEDVGHNYPTHIGHMTVSNLL